VVVIGSTRGEEEEALLFDALALVGFDKVQVIHAPRHLERVNAIADQAMAKTGGIAFRSRGESGPYMVLDTYGELAQIYCVADVVIVGGGFSNLGGQNIMQPLAHGKPVIHGPYMQNFRDVAALAARAGATRVAANSRELATVLEELLDDATLRKQMGAAARELIAENVGASARYADAIAAEARASAV
jgi:3-deoxy-D-manno-octulosonic-acid transferase